MTCESTLWIVCRVSSGNHLVAAMGVAYEPELWIMAGWSGWISCCASPVPALQVLECEALGSVS